MTSNQRPTKPEIELARVADKTRNIGLEKAESLSLVALRSKGVTKVVIQGVRRSPKFRALVFFQTDAIAKVFHDEDKQRILFENLSKAISDCRKEIVRRSDVGIEIDSHEAVLRDFDGNYLRRLR